MQHLDDRLFRKVGAVPPLEKCLELGLLEPELGEAAGARLDDGVVVLARVQGGKGHQAVDRVVAISQIILAPQAPPAKDDTERRVTLKTLAGRFNA